jgi:hypothetical protein
MPAFHTHNRNGFNSRPRDQNITRQVFSRYGTSLTSTTLSRSCLVEDSNYNVIVSSNQTTGTTLGKPLITKFNKKCQKLWEYELGTTFSTDVYRFGSRAQVEPQSGNVTIDVNSLSYITFWFHKTTYESFSPSLSLLNGVNGTIFWIIINNDPTRIYKLAFDRTETDSTTYYKQGINKTLYDAPRLVSDINNRVITVGETFNILFELTTFTHDEIPLAIDSNDDVLVAFRSIRDNATVLYSDNLNGSSWANYCGSSSSITANTTAVAAPNGTFTATRVIRNSNTTCNASTAWGRYWNTTNTVVSGVNYTLSIYVRGAVGGEVITFGITDGNTSTYTLTTEWQKITYTADATSNSRGLQIFSSQPNITFYFWGGRVERTEYINSSRRFSFFLTKLNGDKGEIRWTNEYYLNSDPYISNFSTLAPSDIKSIITDRFNNIYVSGSATSSQGSNVGVGNNYGFIIKLSPNGTILWKKSLYASQAPILQAATSAGLQITSLSLTSNQQFLYASGGSFTTDGAGPCLYKINANTGDLETGWPLIYNLNVSLNEFIFISEIAIDTENNIYGIIGKLGLPESSFDYTVAKFDPSGNILWINRYDANDTTESGVNMAIDNDDLIYIAGRCDTILNERPGVLTLNTDQTVNSFRRLRYREFPFIDEIGLSLRKQKSFTVSKNRNRITFLLNQVGLNGYTLAMIQKEKFAIGTYENDLDRYVVSGSNPIITDLSTSVIQRSYLSTYQTETYFNKISVYSQYIIPSTNYYTISTILVPQ